MIYVRTYRQHRSKADAKKKLVVSSLRIHSIELRNLGANCRSCVLSILRDATISGWGKQVRCPLKTPSVYAIIFQLFNHLSLIKHEYCCGAVDFVSTRAICIEDAK
jgi:hypothetical protein